MNASFFANSSNVKISGGEFNVVHGNYTVFDQSRHTSNVNSFNTTNNTTVGSHNDNSQQFYGGSGRTPSNLPGPDTSRRNGAPSDAPYPNGQYFPPPAVHPALTGGATNLPHGSTVNNNNSLNTTQTNVDQAYNDNSRAYNVPLSAPPRTGNPNVGPRANPYAQQYASYAQPNDQNSYGNPSPTSSAYNVRGMPNVSPGPGGQSPSRAEYYGQDPNASHHYGRSGAAGQYVSGAQIQYGHGRRGNGRVANFAPGNVQGFTPGMDQAFSTLMKEVAQMTAPDPPAAMQRGGPSLQHLEENSDSDMGSSDDEDDRREPTDPHNLRNGMANLSLVDASTHPAYSRVKSDPEGSLPTHKSLSAVMNRDTPVHSESLEEVPQHMKEGVIMGQAPPERYSRAPQAASPSSSSSSATSPLAQFGLDNKPDAIQGPATFNTYNGNISKYDHRHHITNIDSGNTQNNLVKDSYNDNSMQSYAASPQPESAKSREKAKKRHRFGDLFR